MTLQSLDVLREEHAWITRLLECLERVLEESEARGKLAGEAAVELLALLTHFADGLHQEREETCLFPRLLARAGSVEERLAVARLCGDHEEERHALRQLGDRLLGAIYGRRADLLEFARAARIFTSLQRQHIRHENLVLLPLAERLLAPADDPLLLAAYRELEASAPEHARVGPRVAELGRHLGLAPVSAPAANER